MVELKFADGTVASMTVEEFVQFRKEPVTQQARPATDAPTKQERKKPSPLRPFTPEEHQIIKESYGRFYAKKALRVGSMKKILKKLPDRSRESVAKYAKRSGIIAEIRVRKRRASIMPRTPERPVKHPITDPEKEFIFNFLVAHRNEKGKLNQQDMDELSRFMADIDGVGEWFDEMKINERVADVISKREEKRRYELEQRAKEQRPKFAAKDMLTVVKYIEEHRTSTTPLSDVDKEKVDKFLEKFHPESVKDTRIYLASEMFEKSIRDSLLIKENEAAEHERMEREKAAAEERKKKEQAKADEAAKQVAIERAMVKVRENHRGDDLTDEQCRAMAEYMVVNNISGLGVEQK